MTKPLPLLGHAVDGGEPIQVDIEALIGTDLCAIAKKGFGKSGLLRVFFEQTYGLIQQIILDPEGEFHSLREKNEYLIAGGEDADCPATPANAAALAKMLMENPGVSAVIQLDHLGEGEPERFVALFIEELMRTRKEFWHPVIVCVDETQRFAPQDGVVASSAAMKDMVRRGRKRGITPMFATLRNAAINKDLTDGVSTWLFGRVGTDIDRRLVANSLGFPASSDAAKELLTLKPRQFWAYGNAISDQPVLFNVADAQTTIVKSGGMVAMPPPPKSLQKLLEAISKAAAPQTPAEPVPAAPGAPTVDLEAIRKEAHDEGVGIGYDAGLVQGQGHLLDHLDEWIAARRREMLDGDINVGVDDRDGPAPIEVPAWRPPTKPAPLFVLKDEPRPSKTVKQVVDAAAAIRVQSAANAVASNPAAASSNAAAMSMLETMTKHWPMCMTWAQICSLSGRKPKGGSFNTARRLLLTEGLIEEAGAMVAPSKAGLAMKPPPQDGADKLQTWLAVLPAPADLLLQHLVDHPGLTREELAEATGRAPRGGSWHTAMRHLTVNDLIREDDGHLSASRWLFD